MSSAATRTNPGDEIIVLPTGAALGAEVQGVDLRHLNDAQFIAIHRAWLDHAVLLFRGQALADADLIAFSRRFGGLDFAPVQENGRASVEGFPELYVVSNVLGADGAPIGSHYVPGAFGYVDTTGINPFNIEKAKALLKEAGVALPLNVTLTLPPPAYARKGGEIIAAQLAKVGIVAKIENVEWAQWLSGPFKGNFDLTVISHVEPLDFDRYGDTTYYYGYDSKAYRDLLTTYNGTADPKGRLKLLGDIQRQLATDSVNAYLFQLPQFAVANKRLKGLWSSSPIFANDLGALSWQ